ncbi:hypothetical protein M0802_003226 [Mischocyttarus mexicanus]|nr:hypothetical protein M0802_003226 [Mischocyttarus mexicanus]
MDGTVNAGIAEVVVVVGGGNWETETDMDLIRLTVDDVSPCWGFFNWDTCRSRNMNKGDSSCDLFFTDRGKYRQN